MNRRTREKEVIIWSAFERVVSSWFMWNVMHCLFTLKDVNVLGTLYKEVSFVNMNWRWKMLLKSLLKDSSPQNVHLLLYLLSGHPKWLFFFFFGVEQYNFNWNRDSWGFIQCKSGYCHIESKKHIRQLGLGDMAQKMITIFFLISVDIDNYHDKCQIFISFKVKARFLLRSESCRNQTINYP